MIVQVHNSKNLRYSEKEIKIESYPCYGEITSLALSPDQETFIVSTLEGYIFCFYFHPKGMLNK